MKSGTKIEGYWAYWPLHGAEFARRFGSKEDAFAYLPIKKENKGRKIPLGPKHVLHVTWDSERQRWSYGTRYVFDQEQVDELFLKMAGEVASAE